MKALVSRGAALVLSKHLLEGPHYVDCSKFAPFYLTLSMAAIWGHEGVAEALLYHGATVNWKIDAIAAEGQSFGQCWMIVGVWSICYWIGVPALIMTAVMVIPRCRWLSSRPVDPDTIRKLL